VRTGKPAHLKTFDYRGPQRYFLTFCTFQRTRRFVSAGQIEVALAQFRRTGAEQRFRLLAYCFMADHVHLLIEGATAESDGLAFIRNAKQYSAFYYRRSFSARLWQRYGFERVLRDDEDSLRVARYILENPVRAGLVTAVTDYPFLGTDVYTVATILEAIQLRSRWYQSG
jgi:putative transposase